MTSIRTVVGVALFLLAVTVMFAPGLATDVPFARQLLIALGVTVIGTGLLYINAADSTADIDVPNPEGPGELPTPGSEVEEQLAELTQKPFRPSEMRRWKETHDSVRTRLRSLAIATLTKRYNLPESRAEELLDSGAWTDDDLAVGFFKNTADGTPSLVPWRNTGPSVGTQARHVVDELGAIERGERLLSEDALTAAENGDTDDQESGDTV